ncbi:MAG: hypothetical protein ACFCUM_04400 [Bacteroidales bacterium]
MEALDQLIRKEERRIDHLLQLRSQPDAYSGSSVSSDNSDSDDHNYCDSPSSEDVNYCIEKAYEQLAIFKIRRYMGF